MEDLDKMLEMLKKLKMLKDLGLSEDKHNIEEHEQLVMEGDLGLSLSKEQGIVSILQGIQETKKFEEFMKLQKLKSLSI